ncbi:hypothetical protein QEN19_001886 [Hanseniaspora menglaensis]
MAVNDKYITLNDGKIIPQLALGTWNNVDFENTINSVYEAIKIGYRHIDTAAIYKNEEEVGKGIKKAIDEGIVKREDLFVTTKLWGTQQRLSQQAIKQSLERLGLDYVDLYLIHWPVALKSRTIDPSDPKNYLCIPMKPDEPSVRDIDINWTFVDTYLTLQHLQKEGLTKSIGVSNFSINNLKELFKHPLFKVKPVVNQVEVHPLFPQDELIEFCNSENIVIEAYSPLGSTDSPILTNETLVSIAKKLNIDVAQVCISWGLKRGYVILPKSSKVDRIRRNFEDLVELSEEDFKAVSNLKQQYGEKRFVIPDFSPFKVFE